MANRPGTSNAVLDSEGGVDDDAEYESDSEEGTVALGLRRREASDDDEEQEDDERLQGRVALDAAFSGDDDDDPGNSFSDADTDGAGTPPPMDNEEDEEDDDEGIVDLTGLIRQRRKANDEDVDDTDNEDLGDEDVVDIPMNDHGHSTISKSKGVGAEDANGKKDVEPFVVPTAGAFYMHDDRFRDSGPRRSLGGRKLWEAKDDKHWVHDMFEELDVRDEGQGLRRGRGSNQGRGMGGGRGRGQGRGRVKVGKMNAFNDERLVRPRRVSGRGLGFKRGIAKGQKGEEPVNIFTSVAQRSVTNELIQKDFSPSTSQTEAAISKRLVSNSVLKSSSPPFYPSRTFQPLVRRANSDVVKGNEFASLQKVTASASVFVPKSKLQAGRVSSSSDVNAAAVGLSNETTPGSFQGRAQVVHLPCVSQPLVSVVAPPLGRVHSSAQLNVTGRRQEQVLLQPSLQNQGQHASGSMLHGSSNVTLSGSVATQQSTSSRSNSAVAAIAGRGVQSSRITYVYDGVGHGGMGSGREQAYAPSQAIAPVAVQYTGQSQGGLGVPAVGVALPSFGGQPQYGFGDSEITWVPVLAGGGALGVGFGSPYVAMEGTPPIFYAQPPVQPSKFKTPRGDLNASKGTTGPWKHPQASESGNEEYEQRQNKPRRYSEMNFGH
ncbi:hypothetical protein O6H91_23G048600 [Diphasiastrum complanatum]|uniref:Uncharacterized protein n=1 Tax=Diphasiastrum complanatum TaxID=34168 RepID=A0ACC2AAF1_DIPCM|nr:hypothetical protein O6H91_23G048600 [Diphasiastrum complanatum]